MEAAGENESRSVEYLAGRIFEALNVLERNDLFAARLILADLWQELEEALTSGKGAPNHSPPVLTSAQRKELRGQVADLALALRARPQSESQEMAVQLEGILSR